MAMISFAEIMCILLSRIICNVFFCQLSGLTWVVWAYIWQPMANVL